MTAAVRLIVSGGRKKRRFHAVFTRGGGSSWRLGIPSDAIAARGLEEYAEAEALEVAEVGQDGRQHLLEPSSARAWGSLKGAAAGAGIDIFIVSAFRSVQRQLEIIERKLVAGRSIAEILAVSAPPGFSEHHTGRAVDVGTHGCRPLEVEFEHTQAFRWLQRNAGHFGFVMSYPRANARGYRYEPWHWCHHVAPGQMG